MGMILTGCQLNEPSLIEEGMQDLAVNEVVEVELLSSPNRSDGKMQLFYMNRYETPYLDFNQFLSNFSKLWGEYTKVERDDTTITITYKYQAEQEIYENQIKIDFENSILYMTNLSSIPAKRLKESTPVEVSLKEYGLELYVDENQKLIPLSVCNFFLSQASSSFLLATENQVYRMITGNPSFVELYAQYDKNRPEPNVQLQQETINYLTFLMDTVYGLKEYQQVESYQPIIEELFNQGDYNQSLNQFVVGLNDAHTRIVMAERELYDLNKQILSESDYEENFSNALDRNLCRKQTEPIIDYRDDVIYMDYRSFSTRDEAKYKKVLDEAVGKIIVLDIRCNGGGYIATSMTDLLDYLSNEPITYYLADIQGGLYSITADARESNNKYILLTSPYSLSAANMFTNYFKELELGMVIGEKTGGGSASAQYFALPDGTVIQLSIDLLMVNSKGELIEEGIEPDIPLIFTPDMDLEETLLNIIDQQ